jgi:hypothetical protein
MRGQVYNLQYLLGLAIAVFLRSELRRANDQILLSTISVSPRLVDQVPVFISLAKASPGFTFLALNKYATTLLIVVTSRDFINQNEFGRDIIDIKIVMSSCHALKRGS